ncbi:CoA ester lyase [Pseudonocardia kujensis]|uniref:HpcH/HpaI aldolase/citrate lyase family protein n=1 Tax=Pseudonocardia kujensis TaxID=1128675 RepID=UPI001E4148B1|nr:CoA ester lyase [Pseudonocardia kujensis]MCE0763222.1 CoA ester lyase [Pseudonocardia kujensis]
MRVDRTLLFTPGDAPRRIGRALSLRFSTVVLDLEDGVGAGPAKWQARTAVVRALTVSRRPGLMVRINGLDDPEHLADLEALRPVLGHAAAVVVPKVESAARLAELADTVRVPVVPVIESCTGLLAAAEIATAPQVARVILGVLDLAAELGVSPVPGEAGLDHARTHLAVASRAAGLRAPIDGPHPDLDDEEGLIRSSRASRALGFGGRVVLHPRHLDAVARAYAPTAAEIERARRVVDAAGSRPGSLRLSDGTFVDAPVVARAQALLEEVHGEPTPA